MIDILEEQDRQADQEIEALNRKIQERMNRLLTRNSSDERKETNDELVWEMVKTSGVFDKFFEEENEKMLRLGASIAGMYLSGKSTQEIAEETSLSKQEVEHLVRKLN